MSSPAWVINVEDAKAVGRAAAYGATDIVLSSEVSTREFLAVKDSTGKSFLPLFSVVVAIVHPFHAPHS